MKHSTSSIITMRQSIKTGQKDHEEERYKEVIKDKNMHQKTITGQWINLSIMTLEEKPPIS